MAVARGFVVALGGDSLALSTDKPLPPQFGGHLRQGGARGGLHRQPERAEGTQLRWRLDKDDVASVFLRLRRNLMGDTLSLILAPILTLFRLPCCKPSNAAIAGTTAAHRSGGNRAAKHDS